MNKKRFIVIYQGLLILYFLSTSIHGVQLIPTAKPHPRSSSQPNLHIPPSQSGMSNHQSSPELQLSKFKKFKELHKLSPVSTSSTSTTDGEDSEIKQQQDKAYAKFIKDIHACDYKKIFKFLENPQHKKLLTMERAQAILKIARAKEGHDYFVKRLLSDKTISLLNSPNGPLVEALLQFEKISEPEKQLVIAAYLPQARELYEAYDSKQIVKFLREAADSPFHLIVIPLIASIHPTGRIQTQEIQTILFTTILRLRQDVSALTTVNNFFRKSTFQLFGSEEKFFSSTLALHSDKESRLSQDERSYILGTLFHNKEFYGRLLGALKAYLSVRDELQKLILDGPENALNLDKIFSDDNEELFPFRTKKTLTILYKQELSSINPPCPFLFQEALKELGTRKENLEE
jgi:hypothetical protein